MFVFVCFVILGHAVILKPIVPLVKILVIVCGLRVLYLLRYGEEDKLQLLVDSYSSKFRVLLKYACTYINYIFDVCVSGNCMDTPIFFNFI